MVHRLNLIQDMLARPAAAQHAFVAAAGLAIFAHIAFIAPALYFLSRIELSKGAQPAESWLERRAGAILWLPAAVSILLFLAMRPAPQDDLLAIAAIAAGHFSHDSFAFSSWGLQPASPWFGYEKFMAVVIQYLGTENGILAIQGLAVTLTVSSVTLAIRNQVKARPDLALLAVVLIGLALSSMALGRAISGRIEAFFFAWAIAAIWMPAILWLAVGLVMAPTYWLAWIYAPAALLLNVPLPKRLVIGVAYAVFAGGIWLDITNGRYPEMFALTSSWLSAREFAVMENFPLLQGIPASPAAVALLVVAGFLLVAGKGARKEWPLAAVAVWFALPDMIRYLPVIATLAAVWIASSFARGQRIARPYAIALLALVPLGIAFANSLPAGKLASLPKFIIPADSIVLGPLESGLYASIYHNRGIKVSPSFEIGATDPVIQKAAGKLQSGEFDCDLLRFYSIDYVIENRMTVVSPCLKLDQLHGTWRLWKTEATFKETKR